MVPCGNNRCPPTPFDTVTAEVASSSLVVPAIPNQALTPVEEFSRGHKKVQIPREASNSAHNSPITIYTFNPGLGLVAPLRALDASIRHFQQSARLPRCGLYAWRLSPPGCKYPRSHGSWSVAAVPALLSDPLPRPEAMWSKCASYADLGIVGTMPSSELCRVELVLSHFW